MLFLGENRQMNRMSATVDWSIVEDEQEWQAIQTSLGKSAQPAPVATTARVGELRLAALAVALFLLLAGVWLWQKQVMLATIASELQGTVAQEVSIGPTGSASSAQPHLEPQAPASGQAGRSTQTIDTRINTGQPIVQMDDYHLQADRVMAEVTVRHPTSDGELLAYRETRFYRQADAEWQRIDPDPALMGPWQTLETDHFTIRYRPIDVEAVTEAAPRLDLLYDKIRRDFGLPITDAHENPTIEIATDGLPKGYALYFTERKIMVPSPTLLSVPAEMTDATVFYQSVVYPLTSLALMDYSGFYSGKWKIGITHWWPVVSAVRLWELWEAGGPLAAGREDTVYWLYQNAEAVSPDTRKAVPEGYDPLCRLYRVWNLSPLEMSIPLFCNELDDRQRSPWSYPTIPTRLHGLTYLDAHQGLTADASYDTIGAETVIEYIVATYGRDHLPRLLAALGEHTDWQTLIPAVFDLSADEFEAGWRTYLATRYGEDEIR
jgi:hypothetical protein